MSPFFLKIGNERKVPGQEDEPPSKKKKMAVAIKSKKSKSSLGSYQQSNVVCEVKNKKKEYKKSLGKNHMPQTFIYLATSISKLHVKFFFFSLKNALLFTDYNFLRENSDTHLIWTGVTVLLLLIKFLEFWEELFFSC